MRVLRTTLIDPTIDEHGSHIVQTGGDFLLVVFDGAVRCAVQMQLDRGKIRNSLTIELFASFSALTSGMRLPMGPTYMAMRPLWRPGFRPTVRRPDTSGMRVVPDHVMNALNLVFEELGALNLKNIAQPVEAFATAI